MITIFSIQTNVLFVFNSLICIIGINIGTFQFIVSTYNVHQQCSCDSSFTTAKFWAKTTKILLKTAQNGKSISVIAINRQRFFVNQSNTYKWYVFGSWAAESQIWALENVIRSLKVGNTWKMIDFSTIWKNRRHI